MTQRTEREIMEVHLSLDAFELRVFARPASIVDLKTLKDVVASLRAYMDAILESRMPESEAPGAMPVEDTVMVAMFSTIVVQSPQPRQQTNRNRSREDDVNRSRKR